MDDTTTPTDHGRHPIRGYELRSALVTILRARGRAMTVAELVEALHRRGLTTAGRPSKVVSDTLRTEVARGRVVPAGRGRYRIGHLARSTAWRMRQRLASVVASR